MARLSDACSLTNYTGHKKDRCIMYKSLSLVLCAREELSSRAEPLRVRHCCCKCGAEADMLQDSLSLDEFILGFVMNLFGYGLIAKRLQTFSQNITRAKNILGHDGQEGQIHDGAA